MTRVFSGEIWQWRGPAPYYFVTVPQEQSLDLKAVSASVPYGWGMILSPGADRRHRVDDVVVI